jgi:hypothetical protein
VAIFPFADLLDALRQQRIPIGVGEYQAAARLLDKWQDAPASEIRLALAALLATNLAQRAIVLETFDALYSHQSRVAPPIGDRQRRRTVLSRTRPWHGATLVLVALLGGALYSAYRDQTPPPPPPNNESPVDPDPPPPPPPGGSVPPDPILPAEPVIPQRATVALSALAAACAAITIFMAVRSRRGDLNATLKAWRDRIGEMVGPYYYVARADYVMAPGVQLGSGDAATILGRRFAPSTARTRIDVDRTLDATLDAGLRPVFVFEQPRVQAPILVLRDLGIEMRPWERKVDALLARLMRSGVRLERWYFEEDAARVSQTPFGRTIALEALAQRYDGAALLVISTGAGLVNAEGERRPWWRVIETWSDRAWLTPINHLHYWRRELRNPSFLKVPVWPMTRTGIIAAARVLTGGDVKVDRTSDAPGVYATDVERMKQLVALVPYPTLEQAEALRQNFLADVPEEVVLFLADELGSSGAIRLSDDELKRLTVAMRRESPDLERQVRMFLRQSLDRSEPAIIDSPAHLRWQLDRAMQDLHLSSLDPRAHPAPRETLANLGSGPIASEVRQALGLASAPATGAAAREIARLRSRRPAPPATGTAGSHWRPGLTWPRYQDLVAGAIIAALAVPVATTLARGRTVEHVNDAYQITWEDRYPAGGALRIRRLNPAAPSEVEIFRDGQSVGRAMPTSGLYEWGLDEGVPTAAYHARAVMPEGNLALSNSVYAPPRREDTTGTLIVDLYPWAVVRIVNVATKEVVANTLTPFRISLPPGSYQLSASLEMLNTSLEWTEEVTAGGEKTISQPMPGFNANRVVDGLLGGARAR